MTRSDRYRQFKALRDEGLLLREIADRTGVACSTVHDVLTDPTGERARERKRRYERACVGCGQTINPNGIRAETTRCRRCVDAEIRRQTDRWILESFVEWHERFGAPPSSYDWNPHAIRYKGWVGSQWRLRRYESTGRVWPPVPTVQEHFGTWNNALRAAGFEPLDTSEYWIGHSGKALREMDREAA